MPKVYATQEERYRAKVKRWLKSVMAQRGCSQKFLAGRMGLTQQGLSMAIVRGSVSLTQLMEMHRVLQFTAKDLYELLGGFGREEEELC